MPRSGRWNSRTLVFRHRVAASFKSSFSRPKRLLKKKSAGSVWILSLSIQSRLQAGGWPKSAASDRAEPRRAKSRPSRAGPEPSQESRSVPRLQAQLRSETRRTASHCAAPGQARPQPDPQRPSASPSGPWAQAEPSRASSSPAATLVFFHGQLLGPKVFFTSPIYEPGFFHGQAPPGGADNGKGFGAFLTVVRI